MKRSPDRMGEGLCRQREQPSQGVAAGDSLACGGYCKEWGRTGVKGLVTDLKVGGQGGIPPGQQGAQRMAGIGPFGALSRRAGQALPRAGWSFRAWGQGSDGNLLPSRQSFCLLSSSLSSSLPKKIPARKFGVCGGLSMR